MKTRVIKFSILFLAVVCMGTECQKEQPEGTGGAEKIIIVFNISPEQGPFGTEFTFSAEGSRYIVNNHSFTDLTYQWDFNYLGYGDYYWDTEISLDPVQTHIYDTEGTYKVVLIAYADMGSKTETKTVVVTKVPDTSPYADFIINPVNGNIFTEFTFDASACSDESTPADQLEVEWDFENDGTWDIGYSTNKIASHQYNTEGEYEVRMNVRDGDGNVSDLIKNLTVENCNEGDEPCPGLAFIIIGGEQYNTVQIGNQCWLNRNLNIGEMILNVNNQSNQTNNQMLEKYCFENESANCETYGGLYQWDEMMAYTTIEGGQGICPDGWHIPTISEWNLLVDYLGGPGPANERLKSCTDDWKYYNTLNTNETGFSGLPGGFREYNSPFSQFSESGVFWSSSDGLNPMYKELVYLRYSSNLLINGGGLPPNTGASVRCLKNPSYNY